MIGTIENRKKQTNDKCKKMNKQSQLCVFASVCAVLIVVTNFGFAWADTGATKTNTIQATDAIKNNPTAMTILENIELFKQKYAAMQQKQQLIDQQNQFIEQQRKIANSYLQNDLASMNAENEASPKSAYANFVTHVDNSAQGVFLDQFNFMQQKIQKAKDAMNQVLKNGGTMQEALQAFNSKAAVHKDRLISINKDLNVKYNLADAKVQSLFNKAGKLNRDT
ncbi:MAG: hypothetical protein ACREAD_09260 [Nitrosopumilaceae archaeon]